MTKPWISSADSSGFSSQRSQRFSLVSVPPGLQKLCHISAMGHFYHTHRGNQVHTFRVSNQPYQSLLFTSPEIAQMSAYTVPALPAAALMPENIRKMRGSFWKLDRWNLEKHLDENSPVPSSSHTSTTSLDLFKLWHFLGPCSLGSFIFSVLIVYPRGKSSQLLTSRREVPSALLSQGAPQASGQHWRGSTHCMSGPLFFQAPMIWVFNYIFRYVKAGDTIAGKAHSSLLALQQWYNRAAGLASISLKLNKSWAERVSSMI